MTEHLRRFEEGARKAAAALQKIVDAWMELAARLGPIVIAAIENVLREKWRAGGGNARDRRRRRRAAWRALLAECREFRASRTEGGAA